LAGHFVRTASIEVVRFLFKKVLVGSGFATSHKGRLITGNGLNLGIA
jgi:hypothetical protein